MNNRSHEDLNLLHVSKWRIYILSFTMFWQAEELWWKNAWKILEKTFLQYQIWIIMRKTEIEIDLIDIILITYWIKLWHSICYLSFSFWKKQKNSRILWKIFTMLNLVQVLLDSFLLAWIVLSFQVQRKEFHLENAKDKLF